MFNKPASDFQCSLYLVLTFAFQKYFKFKSRVKKLELVSVEAAEVFLAAFLKADILATSIQRVEILKQIKLEKLKFLFWFICFDCFQTQAQI